MARLPLGGTSSLRTPPGSKVHGRTGKYIFKQAMKPYLPEQLINRKKMGFSVPLGEWFRTTLRPVFQSLVLSSEMEEFVSPVEARRIWNEHQSGLHNHERKLWNLLMLASWNIRHRLGGRVESGLAVNVKLAGRTSALPTVSANLLKFLILLQ